MNTYRMQYTSHSDLLPDLLETVERLHADDGCKRVIFTRTGGIPITVDFKDGAPNRSGLLIDGLGGAEVMDYDVTMIIFHKADGIDRVLGWHLLKNLVVEIIPVDVLKKMVPPPIPGQFQTVAERRLDFTSR